MNEPTLEIDNLAQLMINEMKDYAIFMLDPKGVIKTWNLGAKNLKQYEPAEIIGQHFSIFYSAQDIANHKPDHELEMAITEGRFEDEDWRFRKDGSRFWANVIITPLRSSQGKLLGFSKITRDLTERKKIEDRLQLSNELLEEKVQERTAQLSESESQFRTLADAMPQLVWIAEPDGFVSWYNQGWFKYTGMQPEEVVAWGWKSVHDPSELEKIKTAWSLSIETGQAFEMEFPLRSKDGEYRWFLSRAIPVHDSRGKIIRWFGTNTDIDDRRKISEMQKNANVELAQHVQERTLELEIANKEMESFSYSVSHDLRAPLRSISGFCARLLSKSRDRLDDEGKDDLDRVLAAAQRMGKLIDDLLDLSRVSKTSINKQPIDLSELAKSVNAELQLSEPTREVSVVIEHPMKPVLGDPGLLRVVLQNLLANARKYTMKNSQAKIEFGETQIGGKNFYFVRDNGVGFDMKYAGKLFGAFQRLHSNEEFTGTGIGLATVKRIVLLHGGEVWADAQPGKGATFFFGLEPRPSAIQIEGKLEHEPIEHNSVS